mmetsp:Transcript_77331/g.165821  ORF Transcript_77331/g.165821 Transcript_77331/m.165821 type:complete len:344 (+) Transcript_77331:135-1166(+)
MSSSDSHKPPSKIAGGKFDIEKKLGAGCFGEVWSGRNTETKETVAVKFEEVQGHALQLEREFETLKYLARPTRPQGFAQCFYFGTEGRYHCMVMELLGKSLEERLQDCNGKFSVETAALVAEQVLRRIEYLHSRHIVHRDIKPENFMFGIKDKVHHLYLIDFGLSKKYWEGKHVQMKSKLSLTGTARYASINAHKGIEQSRRDDLEAIGHMLMYFVRGSLPWSGLQAKTQEEKYRKIREKKEEVALDDLCGDYPTAFKVYLRTTRHMDFQERPDYQGLRKLFKDLRDQVGPLEDQDLQWLKGKDLGTIVPLITADTVRQPDDAEAKKKKGFCCLCGGSSKVKN